MKDIPPVVPSSQRRSLFGFVKPQNSMSRRHLLFIVVLIAAAALGVSAWMLVLRPINVQVQGAERNVAVQVFGLGTVEARVTSKVGFKVSGVLLELRADVGHRVPKGEVLARLDDREQSARVGRTKAMIEQAEANVQRATASVAKAQANYTNAKSINERRQKLVQSNTASIELAQTSQALEDATFAEVNLANSDVLVEGRHQRREGTAAAGSRHVGFPHPSRSLRCHGHHAIEGARVGACRGRPGLHFDRSELGMGAGLY